MYVTYLNDPSLCADAPKSRLTNFSFVKVTSPSSYFIASTCLIRYIVFIGNQPKNDLQPSNNVEDILSVLAAWAVFEVMTSFQHVDQYHSMMSALVNSVMKGVLK